MALANRETIRTAIATIATVTMKTVVVETVTANRIGAMRIQVTTAQVRLEIKEIANDQETGKYVVQRMQPRRDNARKHCNQLDSIVGQIMITSSS